MKSTKGMTSLPRRTQQLSIYYIARCTRIQNLNRNHIIMSNFINKIKQKLSRPKGSKDEQQFTIQPHPAKSNNPADAESPQLGAGLNSSPEMQAHHARDPYIPSKEIKDNLEQPLSRDELRARAAELNK